MEVIEVWNLHKTLDDIVCCCIVCLREIRDEDGIELGDSNLYICNECLEAKKIHIMTWEE